MPECSAACILSTETLLCYEWPLSIMFLPFIWVQVCVREMSKRWDGGAFRGSRTVSWTCRWSVNRRCNMYENTATLSVLLILDVHRCLAKWAVPTCSLFPLVSGRLTFNLFIAFDFALPHLIFNKSQWSVLCSLCLCSSRSLAEVCNKYFTILRATHLWFSSARSSCEHLRRQFSLHPYPIVGFPQWYLQCCLHGPVYHCTTDYQRKPYTIAITV